MNRRPDIQTLEQAPRIDVAALLAGGSPTLGNLTVHSRLDPGSVTLTWRRPELGVSIQCLALNHQPLPLGGVRVHVLCTCGARVRSVYLNRAGDAWGCRWCLGLRYQSQRVHYPSRG